MAKLLGIDIGTSGAKALLIDEHGRILKSASRSYVVSAPHPGWSEQNPDDWVDATSAMIAEIGEPPDAVGFAGQMHGAVFLDANQSPLRPAILWNDQRTAAECEEIDRIIGRERVLSTTCNPPLTGFQAPKALWLRKHEPERFAQVRHILLPKDYVRLKLTGELATDVSDASGTGVFDVPSRRWSLEMLDALGIAADWLPEVHESQTIVGPMRLGIPVVAGAGDQAGAAVGTGAIEPGTFSISLGTSGVVFHSQAAARYDPDGACHTFCHANGQWHAMGVTLACGGSVAWAAEILAGGDPAKLELLAANSPPGSNSVTFLPYLSGERCPHLDPFATGMFAGLRPSTGAADLARSVLEGTAFSLLDAMEAVEALGSAPIKLRATGGGAKGKLWIQILCDVLGRPIELLETDEGPAFGAALLAGTGIGVWPDLASAVASTVRIRTKVEPSGVEYSGEIERYRSLYPNVRPWYRSGARR